MFMQTFPSMRSNSCFRLHANTFSSLDHLAHYWCSAGAKSAMERCIQMSRTKEKLGRVRPKQILNQKWNWLASHDTLSSPMKEKSPLDNESQTQQKKFYVGIYMTLDKFFLCVQFSLLSNKKKSSYHHIKKPDHTRLL